MKCNLKTLAESLNLSTATVSKALNDSHEISAKTKQRVKEQALMLNYTPDVNARSLRTGKSKTIAVVIPEIADSFFAKTINGIEEAAQANGYQVLFYLTHESAEKEKSFLEYFEFGRVDGILISVTAATGNSETIKKLEQKKIPVVFFDRVCESLNMPAVITDDFESGRTAANHLLQNGCKNIALLTVSDELPMIKLRCEGYQKALEEAGLLFEPSNIIHCGNDEKINYDILKAFLSRPKHADGIIISVEKLISTTYLVCRELSIDIPREIKVVAFSNLQTAELLSPSLTTITQPAYEMGKTAAIMLFKILKTRNYVTSCESLVLPSVLEVRNSTMQ